MLVSVALYVFWSRHWPLIGDASLIHYICFLMDHGMAPYRIAGDMNLPGALMVDWTIMHTLGSGDVAERIFDLALLALAALAIFEIARPYDRFTGLFAAALFALVHGRDGLLQDGQRDLTVAVLLALSTALLFRAMRSEKLSLWAAAAFGLCAGAAATIKPTALFFAIVLFLMALALLRRRGLPMLHFSCAALLGLVVAPAASLAFLLHERALGAFVLSLRTIVPYYAGLGHRPLSFLLLHSISPLLPLACIWVVLLAVAWPPLHWERAVLMAGSSLGLVSYILQARGFPYYRYPLLAFLLPLMAIDFTSALRQPAGTRPILRRTLAAGALAVGALFIAPVSAWDTHQYEWWNLEFISSLDQNLARLGGSGLSGRVQCIDSISGCGTALYRMRLVQSTGVLSDFLLFGPDATPIIHHTREQFLRALAADPPRVIVVSSSLHIEGPEDYKKLDLWPAFKSELESRYTLATDWSPQREAKWWSRKEWPKGYRIYVLKEHAPAQAANRLAMSPAASLRYDSLR
jgi:hypothetical protein